MLRPKTHTTCGLKQVPDQAGAANGKDRMRFRPVGAYGSKLGFQWGYTVI